MKEAEIASVLTAHIVSRYLHGDPGPFDETIPFLGVMDSLGLLELVEFVEQRFQVEIDIDGIELWELNVNRVRDMILAKRAQAT